MNPLLFADWNRMNRLFTRIMWLLVIVLALVVSIVLLSSGSAAHAASAGHPGFGAAATIGHSAFGATISR